MESLVHFIKEFFEKVEVENVDGTSNWKKPEGYTVWRGYWEDCKGRKLKVCAACDCNEPVDDGSHVRIVGESEVYLVPLCDGCNHRGNTFYVRKGDLLPAPSKSGEIPEK